jgi:hypothetical protein
MKKVIIIIFIIIILSAIYKCFKLYTNSKNKEGFINTKSKIVDILKGENRKHFSDGFAFTNFDDIKKYLEDYILELKISSIPVSYNVIKPKLDDNEYLLGSVLINSNDFTNNQFKTDNIPHKLVFKYNKNGLGKDHSPNLNSILKRKDLTNKDSTKNKIVKEKVFKTNNNSDSENQILLNFLNSNNIDIDIYNLEKIDKLTTATNITYNLDDLMGLNIKNVKTNVTSKSLMKDFVEKKYFDDTRTKLNFTPEFIEKIYDSLNKSKSPKTLYYDYEYRYISKKDYSKNTIYEASTYKTFKLESTFNGNPLTRGNIEAYLEYIVKRFSVNGIDFGTRENITEEDTKTATPFKIEYKDTTTTTNQIICTGVKINNIFLYHFDIKINNVSIDTMNEKYLTKIDKSYDENTHYKSENKTLIESVQTQFKEIIKDIKINTLPIIYELNTYIHQIPDELYSYNKEKELTTFVTNIDEANKDYSFIYIGDILSNNSNLDENKLKEYLKIPLRCLLDTGEVYGDTHLVHTIETNKELFLHPIYNTIKLNKRGKPIYKIKPCVELQTTFKEKIEFYKNVKERCKDYASLNRKMPIFENLEFEIKNKNNIQRINNNNKQINQLKKKFTNMEKDITNKNNIKTAMNRSKLNNFLNKKQENMYKLEKKLYNGLNTIGVNMVYEGEKYKKCIKEFKKPKGERDLSWCNEGDIQKKYQDTVKAQLLEDEIKEKDEKKNLIGGIEKCINKRKLGMNLRPGLTYKHYKDLQHFCSPKTENNYDYAMTDYSTLGPK